MIRDEEFDVYVSEGALVEVWRGEHVTVAQQFGCDWDGPTSSMLHPSLFVPPRPAETTAREGIAQNRSQKIGTFPSFRSMIATCAAIVAAAIAYGIAAGWW